MTALVLLFLVSPGESDAAVTLAMRQAAIQVLGPATAVVIREAADGLPDVAAIDHGDALHAAVVVRLHWASRSYLRARLRLHVAGTAAWANREVDFESRDAPAERGRTLGYSVAAVIAEGLPPGTTPRDTAPSAVLPDAAAAPGAETRTPRRDIAVATRAPESATESDVLRRFLFLDVAGNTSTGLGGTGGHARLGWSPTQRLRVMLGGGARVGTVGAAQANSTHLYATAGAAIDLVSFRRIAFAGRGEALLVRQSLSHFSDDDITTAKRARWLVGVRPQLEVSVWPTPLAAIVASAGWELTTGNTDVYVHGVKVAVIPASRAIGELGFRVHF